MRTVERIRLGDHGVYAGSAPPAAKKPNSRLFMHYEYGYYITLAYSYLSSPFGISVPFLATLLIIGLTGLIILRRRTSLLIIYRPIFRPMLCIGSFVALQYYFYGVGMTDLISFFVWAALIVIIQSLYIREGFLHRFAFATFATGMALIPFMGFRGVESARAGLATNSVLANPNALGEWFGFCAIYFLIRALQTSRLLDRLLSWALTFVSLIIVGYTVSRSALVSIAVALVVCFRGQLRRGFIPILIVVVVAAGAMAFGVFDSAVEHFVGRGTEESSRTGVIPYAFQRFLDSPLVGVGLQNLGTTFPGHDVPTAPHNALLFFPLTSGVAPIFLFLAYMLAAFKGAYRTPLRHPYSGYLMPLLVYSCANLLFNDTVFMFPWFIATFSACLTIPQVKNYGSKSRKSQHHFFNPMNVPTARTRPSQSATRMTATDLL